MVPREAEERLLEFPACVEAARTILQQLYKRASVSADERILWSLGILTASILYLAIFRIGAMKNSKEEKDGKEVSRDEER